MSTKDCIVGKGERGVVKAALATEASDLFTSIKEGLSELMSDADAAAQAGVRTVEEMEARLARKKANRAKMAQMASTLSKQLQDFRGEDGVADPGRALLRLITRDLKDKTEGVSNTWNRGIAVEAVAHSLAERFLEQTRPKWAGLNRGKARLESVIRSAFGEQTDEASEAAWGAADTAMNYLRERFNRAGGQIKFRKDHGPPQMTDMRAVARVTPDEYTDFLLPRLAPEKMYHPETGKLGLNPEELRHWVAQLHEKLRTNGWAGTTPGFTRKRRALANAHMDARWLVFKDADSYFSYQQRFGTPDIYDAITSHMQNMSREIGLMEILGPDPDAMVVYLKQSAEKQVALEGLDAARLEKQFHTFDTIQAEQTGAALTPVGGREGWANVAGAGRNLLVSAILGGSAITSLSDLQTRAIARTMAGMPNFGKSLRDLMRLFVPRSTADKRFAVRQMLMAESATSMALAQHRYLGETVGPMWSRVFADVTLRVSGLTPLTEAGRHLFGLDLQAHFADYVGRAFTDLPTMTQAMLQRYGIDAAQWARLTPDDLIDHGGTRFLDMRKFYETKEDLAIKFHELMIAEREFASPVKQPRARSMWRFGKSGTFLGEVSNSMAMLKTFPTSMFMLHVMRTFFSDMPTRYRAAVASQLMIGMTLFGALATQMHEITKGRDPRRMDDPFFWVESMTRGGGLGIAGDFLFSDASQYGSSPWDELGGPLTGLVGDAYDLTLGNVWEAAHGEEPRVGKDVAHFLRRYTPGSSIWYLRLALERKVFDELARRLDPEAQRQFQRQIRARRREKGQRYWWAPGRPEPSRAPDLSKAGRS